MKGALGAGILGGAVYAAWRAWNARLPDRTKTLDWSAAPFPFPPVPRPAGASSAPAPVSVPTPVPVATPEPNGVVDLTTACAEPNDDGTCPISFPIKAKLTSGIYHAPGGLNYTRTKADRCYVDGPAAEADGLRPSKV